MDSRESTTLRSKLVDAMRGHESHVDFEAAIEGFPSGLRGAKPPGAPHTAWQLLEHMRIAQRDILDFSRDPKHKSPKWPEGYWPAADAPPTASAWDHSVRSFQADARELNKLMQDGKGDLFKPFEHGEGQNLLREALLVATHNSYHLGQLVFLKKMLLAQK